MAKDPKKLKLLIITQKVDINDDILGFFHGWIKKLAEKIDRLDVICLYKGKYDLPNNVQVYSLGKEENGNRLKYLWRLYKYAWKLLPRNDLLFVHMNHKYVLLLWSLAKIFRKPVALFKAHRAKQLFLKTAMRISNKVISYSKESFPFKTKKLSTVPPAINISNFKVVKGVKRIPNEILFVGRTSPVKNLKDVVRLAYLLNQKKEFNFKIIGEPINGRDEKYLESIKKEISTKNLEDHFEFLGKIPNVKLSEYYNKAAFFVNLCNKTGIDKTLLEAMACGSIPITNQTTIKPFLNSFIDDIFVKSVIEARNKTLNLYHNQQKRYNLSKKLSQLVNKNHNLNKLIGGLVREFKNLV